MLNIRNVLSAVAAVACQNQIIIQHFCGTGRMYQSQVRKRTSARLLQREDIKENGVNNFQGAENLHEELAEHTKTAVARKRKTNSRSIQSESKQAIQKTVNGSKRSKAEISKTVDNDKQQKIVTDKTTQNKRQRGTSDKESSVLSKNDPSLTECEQVLDDQELLVRYKKRLEDLKKNNVISTTPIFESLCARYERLRNDSRAAAMSKYMRNQFAYFGIPTPQRKSASADLWEDVKKLSSSDLRTLAHQTWFSPESEFQFFTIGLLEREMFRIYEDEGLSTKDIALKTLNFVKGFIEHSSSWWDTVDSLSPNVVGQLVKKYPRELLPEMDKWNVSSCFWVCRTSIIYQLSYKKDTDAHRLFRYCLKVADQEEFFIRKAIGWALRQYYRTDPEAVRNFVLKHKDKLSALSVKEALKHDK